MKKKTKAGSFGARPCTTLRRRLIEHGPQSLPPSFQKSGWIMQRIIATPPWADFKLIRLVYAEADRMTELTGQKYVVDHEIPLNHPKVCGLHVDYNLRVIHWRVNGAKSNKWNPDQMELFNEPSSVKTTQAD